MKTLDELRMKPTRMQVQNHFNKVSRLSTMNQKIKETEKSMGVKNLKVDSKGQVMSFEEFIIDEGFFKVTIPDMSPTFIEVGAASAVKNDLRRKLKPEVFKELSIERVTVGEMKKMYRDMAQGKEVEEEVEIEEAMGYALVVGGKVAARGSKSQLLKKAKKDGIKLDPKGDKNFLTMTGKEVGDSWKEEVEKRKGPPRITNMWKREEVKVEEGSEKNLDALRTALAKSKFKKAGGKVEKQPPGIARGALKFRGKGGTTRDDDEEDKINRDVMAWRKLRAARKKKK